MNFVQFKKLQQDDWYNFEREISEFERVVSKCMRILGGSNEQEVESNLNVIGQDLYVNLVRPLLESVKIVAKTNKEVIDKSKEKNYKKYNDKKNKN